MKIGTEYEFVGGPLDGKVKKADGHSLIRTYRHNSQGQEHVYAGSKFDPMRLEYVGIVAKTKDNQ